MGNLLRFGRHTGTTDIPADLPPVRLSEPAQAGSHEYLRMAVARFRRRSRETYDQRTYPAHIAAMWVDIDLDDPTGSVSPFSVQNGSSLALLVVGWSGVENPRHREIPDVVSTLTPIDPAGVADPVTYFRSLCVGPTSGSRGRGDSSQQFSSSREAGWLHCSLAIAEQLELYLADRVDPARFPLNIPVPTLGCYLPGTTVSADGVPAPGSVYRVDELGDSLPETAHPVWLAGGFRPAEEFDAASQRRTELRGCSPWAVFEGNVTNIDWILTGISVKYTL